MASILFRDRTGRYDGTALESRPLGGLESSLIRLARELAARGHEVVCSTPCERAVEHEGVRWQPLAEPPPPACDLYVAVQNPRLLSWAPQARRRVIWVMCQPNQLVHYKNLPLMWRHRPVPLLISLHQVRIYSRLLPHRDPHVVVPHGLPDDIRGRAPLPAPPPPHAVFVSNPSRGLARLVEIWAERIHPRCPEAELHVYGIKGLEAGPDAAEAWGGRHLPPGLSPAARRSVVVHADVARETLMEAVRGARVMPYLGHRVEAFCLALAEAQALGVPAVVAPVAVLPERVIDGVTGFVREDPARFAEAVVALLTDDGLWRRQHEAALRFQQGLSWRDVANRFENALLGDMVSTLRSDATPPERVFPQPAVAT